MEHEEYTAETYPCSGKKYNGEKAIISLTSWKARINTVSKTLFSLIQQCPGFHIVLCLSEEEFPERENELPENLMLFVKNELIEILWVYKNYKVFKKILFTMDKYRDVPVISADDDCIYTCNYAQELYDKWLEDKKCVIRYNMYNKNPNWYYTQGPSTLYPIYVYNEILYKIHDDLINKYDKNDLKDDDTKITNRLKRNNITIKSVHIGHKFCFIFHDEINPTNNNTINPDFKSCYV